MVLFTLEVKKECGGSLLLEKATIKKGEIPVLLAVVCQKGGSAQKETLRDAGAWFQNKAVANIQKNALSLKKDVDNTFEKLCGENEISILKKQAEAGELSFVFCAGENAVAGGEGTYILQQRFGSAAAAEALPEGLFSLGEGATILLTDGNCPFLNDKNKLECLFSASNEDALERSVREVSEGLSDMSFICIKVGV